MKHFVLLTIAPLVLLAACDQSSSDFAPQGDSGNEQTNPQSSPIATATLAAVDGAPRGTARVVEAADALTISVAASGLTPGRYGIHIHAVGKCQAPGFKSAGGHWNPLDRQHGLDSPKGAHAGDLPNLVIGSNGRGTIVFDLPNVPAVGAGGLLDSDGAAIMIHAGPDDLMTDPSGNSGDRIACGVLAAPAAG